MKTATPFSEYRKASGKTVDEIAVEFDVHRATIFRWEAGDPHIPVKYLDKAEKITGIPRAHLRPDIFGPAPKETAE